MINPKLFNFFGWNPTGDFGPWTMYTAENKKPVMFIKAPPTKPPTYRQEYQHEQWVATARAWRRMAKETRNLWELATKRASLYLTGYNLFVWWRNTHDTLTLQSIIRQSGVEIPH